MSKSLDYEELWDSFTEGERRTILSNLPGEPGNRDFIHDKETRLKWRDLPTTLKFELQTLDWEFSLGKRFA